MYLALLKFFWLIREVISWVHLHALRYFDHPLIQGGHGNTGERAGKLPLRDWRYAVSVVLSLFEALVRIIWQLFRWLFFLNTRNIAEFFLSAVKLVAVLAVLSVGGLYGYLSGEPDSEILADYQRLHQQHTATALLDKQGRLVGAISNPQRQTTALGSLAIELVPPVYWDMLDTQTHRQLDFDYQETRFSDLLFWRKHVYKGIATTQLLNALNPWAETSDSLIKRLSASLNDIEDPESRCFSWFSDFCNTLSGIRLAKHTFPYLANNNGSEFKRWTAMHNRLQGHRGDLNGLRATAEVVFSKRPEQLSNAEQALLAVAQLKQQALLEMDTWDALKAEASQLAQSLYQRDQNALASEINKGLKQLSIPKVIKIAANRQSNAQRSKAVLSQPHLLKRGEVALGSFEQLVLSRLTEEYDKYKGDQQISDAQLSLPVAENLDFQEKLVNRLRLFERKCTACGFKKVLGESVQNSGVHIQVLVADQAGQLVRYFSRGALNDRAIGALSTIPASVLLASKGNTPEILFCNQTYRNLPSSVAGYSRGIVNCDNLGQPGHALSFQEATQVRASLPLFNALKAGANADELQKLYSDFSLRDLRIREGKASHGEQLAYEMSYGVVQSTPMQMLEVIHQLGEMLYGQGNPKAIQSISQFLVSDLQQNRRYLEFSETVSPIRIQENYLRSARSKQTLRQLLSDEVNPKTGVLKALRDINNIRFLLTKTGQSYTKQQVLRDQWLVASVLIRGRRYSISAFVGSADDDLSGLAKNLNAAEMFYPIVAEIVDSLD